MRSLPRCAVCCALALAATTLSACAAPRAATANRVVALRPLPSVTTNGPVAPAEHSVTPAQHLAATTAPPAAGALPDESQPLVTPARLAHGYTIVVVGVNGDNSLSAGLAPGIVEGGYPGAVEVVDWTTGFWPLFVYHLRAGQRHQTYAQLIANKIVAYQARFPHREVNLVGYSAGAVVAVEALEALPPAAQVDRAVLLAGAISPLHDLTTALARTRVGLWNYTQAQDVVALWAGTLVAGTADGHHIVSAGAVGFWTPFGADDRARQLYREKLIPMTYQPRMAMNGNLGGHFQCVSRKFVAAWIAPIVTAGANPQVASAPESAFR